MSGHAASPILEWSCSARPFAGEPVSGDRALVDISGARALALAVDGVGHGSEAARASDRVASVVSQSAGTDLVALLERCHGALAETRGAALSVACLDARCATLTWLGVGSVEGRLVRARRRYHGHESLLIAPGIVGHTLPALRPSTFAVSRGDVLMFATDGVDPSFADALAPAGSCRAMAERAVRRHARETDDALVLVVRYLGLGA